MDERNHPATERQRQRFAERGQIAYSRDLSTVGALAAAAIALAIFGATSAAAATTFMAKLFGGLGTLSPRAVGSLFVSAFGIIAGPTLGMTLAGALLVGAAQSHGHFSSKTLEFDLSRLEPLARLKEMFISVDGVISLVASIIKVGLVAVVCGVTLAQRLPILLCREPMTLAAVARDGGALLGTLCLRVILVMAALALADWAIVWFRLERKMRMTTQEIRDDTKEDLGDPLIRMHRRRRQREILRQRSLRDVGHATVVLVNPTHYAVALLYAAQQMRAPRVVAKGADLAAERIRAAARHAGVPVLADPPLTRLLFRRVRVGAEIPADLYQAVAVVLAHVFKLRQRVA